MAQSINLVIAGKSFPISASSPEMEEIMRTAAEEINSMLANYDKRYPDKELSDKLSFVTLNIGMFRMSDRRKLQSADAEMKALVAELDDYLSDKKI